MVRGYGDFEAKISARSQEKGSGRQGWRGQEAGVEEIGCAEESATAQGGEAGQSLKGEACAEKSCRAQGDPGEAIAFSCCRQTATASEEDSAEEVSQARGECATEQTFRAEVGTEKNGRTDSSEEDDSTCR